MILDCHVHCYRYPEHFPEDKYIQEVIIPQRGLEAAEEVRQSLPTPASKIISGMEEAGVDKSLALAIKAGATAGVDVPNDYLAEEVKPHSDKLFWACSVVMTDPGAPAEVERCVKELGAVAIGELGPAYAGYRLDDPRCYPVYEVARSLDMPLVIHAGTTIPNTSYLEHADLSALDTVCVDFPELKVVLAHFGGPFYQEASFLLMKHPNLFADVSLMAGLAGLIPGRPARVSAPFLHLDFPLLYYFSQPAGDTDKLLWGSDNEGAKGSIEGFLGVNKRLEKMGVSTIPDDALERMFHENWQRVFPKISG